MEDTYTYIARSVERPERFAIFTLHNHSMSVDVGGLVEQIGTTLESVGEGEAEALLEEAVDDTQGEPASREVGSSGPWLLPLAVSIMQRVKRPFNIGDVVADLKERGLAIRAWIRWKGLRLIPIRFKWSEVDNPEAAEAFVDEVSQRRQETRHPGLFQGILDYWITWIGAGLIGGFLVARGLRRKDQRT